MKKIITSLLFVALSGIIYSQQYYDAIELKSLLTSSGKIISKTDPGYDDVKYKRTIALLKSYAPASMQTDATEDNPIILHYYNGNPFFKDITYDPGPQHGAEAVISGISKSTTTSTSLPGGSGLSPATFADAMARFMIERAQAELTIAFFDRFQNFLDKHKEIEVLFPKTCSRMENLLSVNYRQMLNVLRDAFQEDLDNLPTHMIDLVEKIAEDQDLIELTLAMKTLKQVQKLKYLSPVEFINQLPVITEGITSTDQWFENLDASLKTTKIISNSLEDSSSTRNWVTFNDFFNKVFKDEQTMNIFIGLIFQKMKTENISFNGTLFSTFITSGNRAEEIKWYKEQLYNFVSLTEKVETSISEAQKLEAENKSVTHSQLHGYISTTLEIADFGVNIYEHYKGTGTDNNFSTYLSYVEKANNVYEYVYEKQYASAAIESVSLLEAVYAKVKPIKEETRGILVAALSTPATNLQLNGAGTMIEIKPASTLTAVEKKTLNKTIEKVNSKLTDAKKKELSTVSKNLISVLKKAEDSIKTEGDWLGKFTTFAVFMANMIEAETSEDVMAVIESVALPVGSSSIKKNSNFSIGVSSYLGARVGTDVNKDDWSPTVTAPIGIDFSYGIRRGGAFSLNLTLIDIGAIVDYRLSDDSTAIDSEITWGNLFSPGVNLVYGFPFNIPLALGMGVQYGPGLTKLTSDETIINAPSLKFGFFLAVDIPLLNLHNSPKKKKL